MKEKWTKDIHDRLGSYEKDAPEGLWDSIRSNMPQMENVRMRRPEHRHALLYTTARRITAVAAAACVALIVGYRVYNNGGDTPTPQANVTMATHNNKAVVKTKVESGQTEHDNQGTDRLLAAAHIGSSKEVGMARVSDVAPDTLPIDTTQSVSTTSNAHVQTNDNKRSDEMPTTHRHTSTPQTYYVADNRNTGESSSRWSVSTGVMGAMSSSLTVRSIGQDVAAAGPDDSEWEDNPILGIGVLNQGKDITTETRHRLPVRIGLNVAYAVTKRLSIESGLTYTRLSSDISEGTKDNYFYGDQKLDYIGVPINVKYKLVNSHRFSIYTSVGVLAEKCVSGKATKKYVIMSETKDTECREISTKPFQMSVNAAIGAQYDVIENVGIYAEPGLSYYFDDGSSLKTIYKDKPLNFNLNIGIRLSLGK